MAFEQLGPGVQGTGSRQTLISPPPPNTMIPNLFRVRLGLAFKGDLCLLLKTRRDLETHISAAYLLQKQKEAASLLHLLLQNLCTNFYLEWYMIAETIMIINSPGTGITCSIHV